MKGKLIVIDGVDGAGKKTQAALLCEALKRKGFSVLPITYPRYGEPSAALVEMYLRGDFGADDQSVNPYVASTFYAVDRFAESRKVTEALTAGTIVIADRYVTANMAHQGGKIADDTERQAYFNWLHDFEYDKCGIAKPDATLILYAPIEVTAELLRQRGELKDIHEKNPDHLRRTNEAYLQIAGQFKEAELIECAKDGIMMPREMIQELIWQRLAPLFSL